MRPNGPLERDRSTGQGMFVIAAIRLVVLHDRIGHPRHLRRDGRQGLASHIRIAGLLSGVALVFVPKGVFVHSHCPLCRHPEGHAEPGIAPLRECLAPPELPRLARGEIQATVLEELAMMREAAEITALRENHHGQDRRDAWQGAEPLEVCSVLEQRVGADLKGLAQPGQPPELGELQAKRLDRDRTGNAMLRCASS
jgi:hypothetical protein